MDHGIIPEIKLTDRHKADFLMNPGMLISFKLSRRSEALFKLTAFLRSERFCIVTLS